MFLVLVVAHDDGRGIHVSDVYEHSTIFARHYLYLLKEFSQKRQVDV